jgi:hypothetical protein
MKKIIWYKFTKKKKVQIKGPVCTRECDGWKWQRILAVETCRVAWCAHQLWLPRADPLSVQLQHPPRVQTLWPARRRALQTWHCRRRRPHNPWIATTTTQGPTTDRACIRHHVPARAGWRSYVRNRVMESVRSDVVHTQELVCAPELAVQACNTDTRRDHA